MFENVFNLPIFLNHVSLGIKFLADITHLKTPFCWLLACLIADKKFQPNCTFQIICLYSGSFTCFVLLFDHRASPCNVNSCLSSIPKKPIIICLIDFLHGIPFTWNAFPLTLTLLILLIFYILTQISSLDKPSLSPKSELHFSCYFFLL